jgi:hypothetical protein
MLKFLDRLLATSAVMAVAAQPETQVANMSPTLSTQELIDQIHNEFNTAGDKLLAQAKAVIANTDETSFAKAERLKNMGFGMAVGVQDVEARKTTLEMSKGMQDTLLGYAIKYPTYRFIDEVGIKTICEKYNLVFGCISDYMGFVPEKNLLEIEKAPWKPTLTIQHRTGPSSRSRPFGPWKDDATQSMESYLRKQVDYAYNPQRNSYVGDGVEWQFRKSSSFLICAPVKDMDMQGKELVGHKVVNLDIPDPVVLHNMGNGLYAILTAWGAESHDPLVQKEGLN